MKISGKQSNNYSMENFIFFVFIALFCVLNLRASEPEIWSINTRAEVLKGDAIGVSIDENGTISLAPKLNEVFKTEQPYIWSSAVDASGNVFLGTGSDGRIYRVDAGGSGKMFADLNELNVSALAIAKDGALFAGTSPDGKVYRIDAASGNATVFFEPKEKYIWSLAVLNDGSLAVGTGENGKIYRVRQANASADASLLFDTSETHIISLVTDKQGNLYAGTVGSGLVLRFAPDGKPFALLDSTLREIHSLAIGLDGSVYALALGESAAASKNTTLTTENLSVPNETTMQQAAPEPQPKSRYDLTTAKSAVYRIFPDGGSDIIWNSPTVIGFSIFPNQTGNGVLIGTSDKGRIYSVSNDGRETLVLQSNENQISTLFGSGKNIFAASSNQGKLYRFGAETVAERNYVAEGIYESSILNAKASSSWGRIWWRSNGDVVLQTRSGNTEKPNETWSAWSANYTNPKDAQVASPKAKFLQWRAILKNSATLNEVNVSYLERNIAPEILSIQVLPANIGLAANPPIQIDPNIENSGIDPTVFGLPPIAAVPPRRIYQRAARSLQWTAEDRNGDKLEYAVYYREIGENDFKLLRENLRENFYAIDGLAFADGRYIFKIVTDDSPSNPLAQVLSGERISEPVEIDNTAPTVNAVGNPQTSSGKARVTFEASDASSRLQNAEYSINGGEWQTVYADDGISDGQKERYTLEIPLEKAGEYTITLRVFDASGNAGNARVQVRK
jgi:sugar lactone lactonase YvrE